MDTKISTWIQAEDRFLDLGEKNISLSLHVLIEREDELYTAHCLEFDIVSEGNTVNQAEKNIIQAILDHLTFCIAYENMDRIFNPAPKEFWSKFYLCSEKIGEPLELTEKYTKKYPSLSKFQGFIKDVNFGKSHSHVYA